MPRVIHEEIFPAINAASRNQKCYMGIIENLICTEDLVLSPCAKQLHITKSVSHRYWMCISHRDSNLWDCYPLLAKVGLHCIPCSIFNFIGWHLYIGSLWRCYVVHCSFWHQYLIGHYCLSTSSGYKTILWRWR